MKSRISKVNRGFALATSTAAILLSIAAVSGAKEARLVDVAQSVQETAIVWQAARMTTSATSRLLPLSLGRLTLMPSIPAGLPSKQPATRASRINWAVC